MQVFISHASTDAPLAKRVSAALNKAGLKAWDDTQIYPGDNWGEKLGEALRDSDAMVVLLTPDALRSPNVRYDLSYAVGERRYENRLLSVVVAPADQIPADQIPWLLKRFKMIYLNGTEKDDESLRELAQTLLQVPA